MRTCEGDGRRGEVSVERGVELLQQGQQLWQFRYERVESMLHGDGLPRGPELPQSRGARFRHAPRLPAAIRGQPIRRQPAALAEALHHAAHMRGGAAKLIDEVGLLATAGRLVRHGQQQHLGGRSAFGRDGRGELMPQSAMTSPDKDHEPQPPPLG